MKRYGQVIANLRKQQNLTQGQLGKMLNVSYQAVSKWENGLSEPDLQTIEEITKIFNITISDFFAMANNEETIVQENSVNELAVLELDNSQHESNTKGSKKINIDLPKIIKTKPWYVVAGLGVLVVIFALIAILIPVKFSGKQIFDRYDSAIFFLEAQSQTETKSGTGFFINNSGLAVTVYSNIQNCTSGKICLNNGMQYDIEYIVGIDSKNNLAIIKIDIPYSRAVKLGSGNNVGLGECVYTITYTRNDKLVQASSVFTEGIVFKVESDSQGVALIQTTASVDDTNTGGVLFDETGSVIGIITDELRISGMGFDMVNVCVPAYKLNAIEQKYSASLQDFANKHFKFQYISNNSIYKSVDIFESGHVENLQPQNRNGYMFYGWYTDESFVTPFDFGSPVTKETKCYAKWVANTCTLSYAKDENSEVTQTQVLTYGETYNLLDITYEKEGYTHVGWQTLDKQQKFDLLDEITNVSIANNDIVKIIALWKPIEYYLRFDGNGATGSMSNQKLKYDQLEPIKTNYFSKPGYLLESWSYNGQTFADGQEVINLTNQHNSVILLVANWKPIEYTFVFENPEDVIGTEFEIKPMTFVYDESKTLEIDTICYPKQVIERWICVSCTDESAYVSFLIKNGTVILNRTTLNNTVFTFAPDYTPSSYYIRYNPEVGEVWLSSDLQLVKYGETGYARYNDFEKYGYHFVCWSNDVNSSYYYEGETFKNLSETHLEIIEFYANWEINKYHISTYYFGDETRIATLEYNESFTLPECSYTKEGYVFSHWTYQVATTGFQYKTYTLKDRATVVNLGDIKTRSNFTIKLEPVWTPIEYYVQFDSNGGIGQMPTITAKYDQSVDFQNMFTKVNHTLLYWTCGDRIISDNRIPYRLTTVQGQTLTFVAHWIESFIGSGTEQSPYQISSIDEFNRISMFLKYQYDSYTKKYYELTCNIDATGKTIKAPYSFYGHFDGNNYTISNITNCTGLFDSFCGEMRNLHLKNFTLETDNATSVGPFATDAGSPVLENCSVTGSITYTGTKDITIGGLFGSIYNGRGNIINCYSNMTINIFDSPASSGEESSLDYEIGGLVGDACYHIVMSVPADEILTIQNCYAITNVNVIREISANSLSFAGLIRPDEVYIFNSFAKFNVDISVPEMNCAFSTFASRGNTQRDKYTNCYIIDGSEIILNEQQVTDFINVVPWVSASMMIDKNWLTKTLLFDEIIWLIEDGSLPVLKANGEEL